MKLIVGLGNPGKEYVNTRHNVGFQAIDMFVNKMNLSSKEKFNAEYYEYVGNEKIILVKPLSYMNLSGEVVRKYIEYFNIDIEDILIISDDMDMVTGKIRLRDSGSAGGHNGIKNIIDNISTDSFKRLKIGIGNKQYDAVDHVLGKFNEEDAKIINRSLLEIVEIIEKFEKVSFKELQNKYNGEEA